MSDVKRCAACRKEKPVSEMKTCMHAEMHNYVCDSKCMHDFYNPPKAEKTGHAAIIAALQSALGAAEAERDQLRAELAAIRGRPSAELIEAVRELIGAANTANRSRMHEVRGHDDDQPRYWQRKEWVDWLVENGEKARQALDALPPQQPDAVSVPREVCDVPLYAAINRACGELPDGWSIEVNAERDGAWVALLNAELEVVEFPTNNERLDYTVNDAVEFAILSTRQAEEGE